MVKKQYSRLGMTWIEVLIRLHGFFSLKWLLYRALTPNKLILDVVLILAQLFVKTVCYYNGSYRF